MDDAALLQALRAGDETAFMALVERLQPQMLRIARMYVSTRSVAEEVVQEAWVGVLKGLNAFEGRSSLRTWIFRILVNTAKTRGQREARSVPFSSVWSPDVEVEPSVGPERFLPQGDPFAGHWADAPASWESVPEDRLLARETLARVGEAIEALPPNQREVIRMRDACRT
jgi:RNA polymerase sigma-70 factor (ECF subfamily)